MYYWIKSVTSVLVIILDNKDMYHLGTSLNNAGTKTFMISKIEEQRVTKTILNSIYENNPQT